MIRATVVSALGASLFAALAVAPSPVQAASGHARPARVVVVAHGPIAATYVDAPPTGPSAGDLRTYWINLTRPGHSRNLGFMTGSLLTVATDQPRAGMELRTADLVFTIGRPDDQIVLGGVAAYDLTAPTFAKSTATKRPVLGGSGRFQGARGWCLSIHNADNSWRHEFHIRTSR